MKKLIYIFTFLIFNITTTIGQLNLNVVIKNLNSSTGFVVLDLRDENNKHLKGFSEKISNNECTLTIRNLKPGKYSFQYFHDENNNKKLDNYWFKAPKEGYGFSNNAMNKFGFPSFKDTVFELNKDIKMICTAYYINF